MLTNKESLDQIIVATPGLRSDPIALGETRLVCLTLLCHLFVTCKYANDNISPDAPFVCSGVLQDKDLFVQFTDPNMLDM